MFTNHNRNGSITAYRNSHGAERSTRYRLAGAWAMSLGITAGLFLAFPFLQALSLFRQSGAEVHMIDQSILPPPPVPEAEPPRREPEKDLEPPILQREQRQLTLAQIEIALNPGFGDGFAGEYSMDFELSTVDELDLIFDINEVDRAPRATYRVAPAYPYKLKEAGITGSVVVMFVCTHKGRVIAAQVTSSPHVRLSENTIRALRKWKFEPGIRDGEKVNVRMMIPFNFTIAERKW